MASTPKTVKVEIDQSTIDRIREEGRLEGRRQGRQDVFDYLQAKYMGGEGQAVPDRGSPEAEAILALAKEVSDYLMKLRKV